MMWTMNTMNADTNPASPSQTDPAANRRIAWEAERIAEADASIAAGRLIEATGIDAWIDSIGTSHEVPPRDRGTP